MAQTGRILSFLGARRPSSDWTQQELAEFYRVESALLQNGLLVVTERGLSDEGDPWFVFCLSKNEEVIAHFARIDSYYFVVSSAFSGVARGRDFKLLVRELMGAHPLLLPGDRGGQKVFLHPAASLAALLAASYLVSSEKGAEIQDLSAAHEKETAFWLHLRQDLAILSAVAIAATWIENSIETDFDLGQDIARLQDVGQDANLPADLPPHAIDAAVFNATQTPHDDGATHRVGSSPAQPFALEAMKDVSEVIPGNFMPSKLLKDPGQSTVTTSPAAFNVDGAAASHADSTKTAYSVALHDTDTPHSAPTDPEQVLAHPNFVIEARQPLGSSATAPTSTNLGPGLMIPTDTLRVATNDLIVSNLENSSLPAVVSTTPPSSSEIQNVAMSTLSTSSITASTNASAQEVVSASTPPSSANEVVSTSTPHSLSDVHPTTFNAQRIEASLLAFLHHSPNLTVADSHITVEPTHTIVGIVPHSDGTHT